jgi:hypothetical protein
MKKYRISSFFALILICNISLGFQSAEAANVRLCWESFDGFDEYETIDLYFTKVGPGTYSVSGRVYPTGDSQNSSPGIVDGTVVVVGTQATGHLNTNGDEPEADGLLYVGQDRIEIDLNTMIMEAEGIGSHYFRDSTLIETFYDQGTLDPIGCP